MYPIYIIISHLYQKDFFTRKFGTNEGNFLIGYSLQFNLCVMSDHFYQLLKGYKLHHMSLDHRLINHRFV